MKYSTENRETDLLLAWDHQLLRAGSTLRGRLAEASDAF